MRAVVIGVRLSQFLVGVHDEGAMLRHRFTDGTALKHEQFARRGAIDQLHGLSRIDFDGGMNRDGLAVYDQRISLEKVQRSARVARSGCG
jgi:hypothetical protein